MTSKKPTPVIVAAPCKCVNFEADGLPHARKSAALAERIAVRADAGAPWVQP